MSHERWTIAQALAWIACRQALPFNDWTDTAPFAPMLGPSTLLAPISPSDEPAHQDQAWRPSGLGSSVSPAAAQALADQDDGFNEALLVTIVEIKRAASTRAVTVEGRRARQGGADSSVTTVETIPFREFARPGLTAYAATNKLGRDDSPAEEEEIQWWTDVAVDASACRRVWPAPNAVAAWMREWAAVHIAVQGKPPKLKAAVDAAKAAGFGTRQAREAYKNQPANLRNPAPRRA